MNKHYQLEKISVYAGVRFDLVQAGGGNSSVKLDASSMLVKASGINLSQLTEEWGFVEVEFHKVRDWFKQVDLNGLEQKQREAMGNELLASVTLSKQGKPSIETFLHALLNIHTLHTHPVSVNVIACQDNWKTVFTDAFPDAVCVPYATPGIDLALSLHHEIKDKASLPKIVFLQNHGLIISSDDNDEVIELTEKVTQHLNELVGLDLSRYQAVTQLQSALKSISGQTPIVYCSEDQVIAELLSVESTAQEVWPFCPDTLIYCGIAPVYLTSLDDTAPVKQYIEKYSEPPKVIIVNKQVYFVSTNLKKAKESEELMRFHLLVISKNTEAANRLSIDEIAYLSNWDAEKYRQGV